MNADDWFSFMAIRGQFYAPPSSTYKAPMKRVLIAIGLLALSVAVAGCDMCGNLDLGFGRGRACSTVDPSDMSPAPDTNKPNR